MQGPAVRTDRLGGEAERLDPESRALLELSVVRGIPDEDLAGMLGIGADSLRQRRERIMRELGAESAEEREALEATLREGVREPPRSPAALVEPGPPAARRRARAIAAAGGLAIALVVALMLALGGDEGDPPPPAAPAPAGEPAPGGDGRMARLGAGPGSGSAAIVGPEDEPALRLRVSGLPRPEQGGYVVWLYNSISDARPLTGARRGRFTAREPLPPNAADYAFVDVSREPADGNPNHSGQSVLRIAREEIPGR